MMPSHKIKNAAFDLRFRSRTAFLQENSTLGGFVKQRLMPVVDEVLSEHALEDHVVCIDKLEIDLGSIRFSDFKSRLERQLRAKLELLLKAKIRDLHHTSRAQEKIIPRSRRNLDFIKHFLITGTLPGLPELKPGRSPDHRLHSVINQARSDFLEFLKKTAHWPHVIQRLVRQFPAATVRQVARLLAPTQAEKAFKAIDNILRCNQDRPSKGMQTAAFTALVWELTLDYLLQHPNSRFTAVGFHHWINLKAERLSHPSRESLKAAIAGVGSGQQSQKQPVAPPVRPPKPLASKKEVRRIIKGYDLYETLRFYLKHGMMQWSDGILAQDISITNIIDEICASYPEKLIKIASDLRIGPDGCQRLAALLTPDRMKQFISVLASVNTAANDTDQSTFIQSIIEHSEHAPDRQGYYADILHSLVTRRPIDLKQIAARKKESKKTMSRDVIYESEQGSDQIRANLTAMLNSGSNYGDNEHSFSRLLENLKIQYPAEYRDYLMWLAANKKQFTSFLKLATEPDLSKTLAHFTGYPSLQKRAMETLEAWPAEASHAGVDKRKIKNRSLPHERNTEDESALVSYLTGDHSSHPISDIAAGIIFKQMILHGSDRLYTSLRKSLTDKAAVRKLVTLLPENWLIRVLAGLHPDLHQPVQTYADIISDACHSKQIFDRPEKIDNLKWEFIFTYLGQSGKRQFREDDFIRHFIFFLADCAYEGEKANFASVLSRNLTAKSQFANSGSHLTVIRVLNRMAKIPPPNGSEEEIDHHHSRCSLKSESTQRLKMEHPAGLRETAKDIVEEIIVANAGLALAAPYLPRLWKMLDLIEGDIFKGFQEAEKAVHLLQFMADETTASPEYRLVLNKILCGIKLSEPISGKIHVTEKEQETIEGLIRGMIENWKTIGQTSVDGFRESFFQRRGCLKLKDDAWHLEVEQRTFDLLLDQMPWSFSTIKHPWMQRVLYVKWR